MQKLNTEKEKSSLAADKEQILSSITDCVNSITIGDEWDDILYRELVDKIVTYKDRTIDVHLKLIPEKWQAKILKSKAEIEEYSQNHTILPDAGAPVPMSVSVAFSSGRGIV